MNSICRIVRVNGEASEYSFDPEKLVVGAPKKLNKGKFASVRYGSSPLFMETPMLHSPLPPSSFEDAGKKTLFLSCRGHDDDPEVRVFVEGIGKFQTQVIDKASDVKLLGDKPRQTLEDTFSPFLKPSDDYPPAIRVTLPFDSQGVAQFDTFRLDNQKAVPCQFSDVEVKGASVKVIFTISGVWVVNKLWGVSAKATQVLVKPAFDCPASGLCCFSDIAIQEDGDERDVDDSDDE